MDPLDDLLESMEELSREGDKAEAREVLQATAAGLTEAWQDKAAMKARIRDLTQLLHIFLKAGKTLRLYQDDHTFFDGFVQEFIERLYVQFETLDAVTFEVTPESICWDGHVIFSNPEQRSNMAFKLYRDGIRLIQFRRGCTVEELREFVALVTRDLLRGVNAGDDLSALFWEADFKAIQIAVAETFVDYSEEAQRVLKSIQEDLSTLQRSFELDQTGRGGGGNAERGVAGMGAMGFRGLDTTAQRLGGSSAYGPVVTDLDGDTALRIYRAGGDSGGAEDLIDANPNKPYTPLLPLEVFNDERMASIYEELQGLDNPVTTFEDIGVVLSTVIEAEQQPEELAQLLAHLDEAVSPLLGSASLGPLNSVLRRISLLAESPSPHKRFQGLELHSFFQHLCQADRLELLARAINTEWRDDLSGELFTFVSLQNPQSFDELLRFLGMVEPKAPRRVITDALLLLCKRDSAEFLPLLDDANARLTVDALYALSRIGDSMSLSRICAAFERSEWIVREAVLGSLKDFQSPRINKLMIQGLADPEPRVRLAALRYITVYRIRGALPALSQTIRTRGFSSRDFNEKRGWFIALGHVSGNDGLTALKKLAEPHRGRDLPSDDVHLALLAIKATRSVDGKTWLEAFAQDAKGDLKLLTHKVLSGRKGGR